MFGSQLPSVTAGDVPADAYLLDVREQDEWDAGHAPGAHHLPMQEVPARLEEIPSEGDVVVVCRMGGRSGQVVNYLLNNGWDNVRNLEGGMKAWSGASREMVTDDGTPPRVI